MRIYLLHQPDNGSLFFLMQAMERLKAGEAIVAMDPKLRRSPASNQAVEKVLKLARQCLVPLRQSRPSMRKCAEVLWAIRKEFREKAPSFSPSPTSRRSDNFLNKHARKNRHPAFGLEDSDSYKFVSA